MNDDNNANTTERVQESDLEEILNKLSQEELAWLAILFLFWGVFKPNMMPEADNENT